MTELLARQEAGTLSADESSELAVFLQLEHVMRLAEARARRCIASGN